MLQKVKDYFNNWKWTPAKAGVVIGLAILISYFYYSPLGMCVGCYIGQTLSWIDHKFSPTGILFPGIPAAFQTPIIGMFIGALLGSISSREFRIKRPKAKMLIAAILGGVLIGFGVFVAGGCSFRHGIVGLAGLAIESWVAVPAMIIGILVGTKLLIRFVA